MKHLEISHPDQFTRVMMAKVEISSTSNNVKRRKLDLIDACVRLIIVHGRPFALIDDEAFQEIINAVPQFSQSQPRELINSRKVRNAVAQRNQSKCNMKLKKRTEHAAVDTYTFQGLQH